MEAGTFEVSGSVPLVALVVGGTSGSAVPLRCLRPWLTSNLLTFGVSLTLLTSVTSGVALTLGYL